jgi:hypothetical protein
MTRKFQADRLSHYLITGIDIYGKRFRIITDSYLYALGINVWKGTKWFVDVYGRRQVWQRITN